MAGISWMGTMQYMIGYDKNHLDKNYDGYDRLRNSRIRNKYILRLVEFLIKSQDMIHYTNANFKNR